MSGASHEVDGLTKQTSGCSEPGCRVPPELARYKYPGGGRACISHAEDQRPKLDATRKGGHEKRRKETRGMPAGTPNPDWSTPKAIRAWLEDRAGRIERLELDQRNVPYKLAEIAKATHDSEALEKLGELEQLIRARLGSNA
jgi:hypothetical protein